MERADKKSMAILEKKYRELADQCEQALSSKQVTDIKNEKLQSENDYLHKLVMKMETENGELKRELGELRFAMNRI